MIRYIKYFWRKRPPFKFNLRTLFFITTVTCVVLFSKLIEWRGMKYKQLYETHWSKATIKINLPDWYPGHKKFLADQAIYRSYHFQMAEKYKRAYSFPLKTFFAPLEPDPPEPLKPSY